MRSKAHFRTHPLHPIFISFPIAFFTATFLFDMLFLLSDDRYFGETAVFMNVAGIISAVIAAVPGIIDYIYTVPPASSAKKRAATHGMLNSSALIIFTIVYFLRSDLNQWLLTTMEVVAMTCLITAGWMGGTLVRRNQVGVDIRYAHAGKWNEKYISGDDPAEIGKTTELKPGQMMLVHYKGKRIAVCRTDDGYFAIDDHCTHKGGSLASGALVQGIVQCPWHGSQFDCRTGEVKAGPAKKPVNVYTIAVKEGLLYLETESDQPSP